MCRQVCAEESKKFVIRAVLDPRTDREISFQDAIARGIVDPERGLYVNTVTGEGVPIPQAMNAGLILVDYCTTSKSQEKKKAVGIITVRTAIDRRKFTVRLVTDAVTTDRVDLAEARKRGIVDEDETTFTVTTTGEQMDLRTAVQIGWIQVRTDIVNGPRGLSLGHLPWGCLMHINPSARFMVLITCL